MRMSRTKAAPSTRGQLACIGIPRRGVRGAVDVVESRLPRRARCHLDAGVEDRLQDVIHRRDARAEAQAEPMPAPDVEDGDILDTRDCAHRGHRALVAKPDVDLEY